jgi:hypothetical protein
LQGRILLYFKQNNLKDRWFYGDRYIRSVFKLLFQKRKINSLERVFINLCKGLDLLAIKYKKNLPFNQILPNDKIIVLGSGKHILDKYKQPNKIIAGIGLMTHPNDWPTLFEDYPISTYLQHSEWTTAIYNKWYRPNSCKIWPVGIDTRYWKPEKATKRTQVLIYVKFLWHQEQHKKELLDPIIDFLIQNAISYQLITYGGYHIQAYKDLLNHSKAMIFLCEHESQGLAYQEAMAMDVPIFAWNQGLWLDKNLLTWGETEPITASSVPYFNSTCGDTFKDFDEFKLGFERFCIKVEHGLFKPREYILNHLTLEKSAERMLAIIKEVYQ